MKSIYTWEKFRTDLVTHSITFLMKLVVAKYFTPYRIAFLMLHTSCKNWYSLKVFYCESEPDRHCVKLICKNNNLTMKFKGFS
jgi:hypothetical protein